MYSSFSAVLEKSVARAEEGSFVDARMRSALGPRDWEPERERLSGLVAVVSCREIAWSYGSAGEVRPEGKLLRSGEFTVERVIVIEERGLKEYDEVVTCSVLVHNERMKRLRIRSGRGDLCMRASSSRIWNRARSYPFRQAGRAVEGHSPCMLV